MILLVEVCVVLMNLRLVVLLGVALCVISTGVEVRIISSVVGVAGVYFINKGVVVLHMCVSYLSSSAYLTNLVLWLVVLCVVTSRSSRSAMCC